MFRFKDLSVHLADQQEPGEYTGDEKGKEEHTEILGDSVILIECSCPGGGKARPEEGDDRAGEERRALRQQLRREIGAGGP